MLVKIFICVRNVDKDFGDTWNIEIILLSITKKISRNPLKVKRRTQAKRNKIFHTKPDLSTNTETFLCSSVRLFQVYVIFPTPLKNVIRYSSFSIKTFSLDEQ